MESRASLEYFNPPQDAEPSVAGDTAEVPIETNEIPTVLTKLQKWADYPAIGNPVHPTRFLPMKTPMSLEIISNWSLPEPPKYSLTIPELLSTEAALHRKVGLIIDLANHQCLYADDVPPSLEYAHIQLVAKVLPPPEAIDEVQHVAEEFWSRHPDHYVAIHCAYGFNRTGFVVCSFLCQARGMSVPDALESFAAARPPGVKHGKFVDELYLRYGNSTHGQGHCSGAIDRVTEERAEVKVTCGVDSQGAPNAIDPGNDSAILLEKKKERTFPHHNDDMSNEAVIDTADVLPSDQTRTVNIGSDRDRNSNPSSSSGGGGGGGGGAMITNRDVSSIHAINNTSNGTTGPSNLQKGLLTRQLSSPQQQQQSSSSVLSSTEFNDVHAEPASQHEPRGNSPPSTRLINTSTPLPNTQHTTATMPAGDDDSLDNAGSPCSTSAPLPAAHVKGSHLRQAFIQNGSGRSIAGNSDGSASLRSIEARRSFDAKRIAQSEVLTADISTMAGQLADENSFMRRETSLGLARALHEDFGHHDGTPQRSAPSPLLALVAQADESDGDSDADGMAETGRKVDALPVHHPVVVVAVPSPRPPPSPSSSSATSLVGKGSDVHNVQSTQTVTGAVSPEHPSPFAAQTAWSRKDLGHAVYSGSIRRNLSIDSENPSLGFDAREALAKMRQEHFAQSPEHGSNLSEGLSAMSDAAGKSVGVGEVKGENKSMCIVQ